MRRFAPRLPVTCHSLNPSPPLIRSSNNSLSYPSSRGYNLSLFVVLSFLYVYVYTYFFLSKNFPKITSIALGLSVWFRLDPRTLVLKRSPLSLSLFRGRRQMSDGKERKVQHRRCSIVFSFTILRRLSLVLISPNFYHFFLSSSFSSSCITLLSRLIAKARRASERTNGQEVR